MIASKYFSKGLLPAGLAASLLLAAPVHAHYPWLIASNYSPDEGRSATAFIGWGHTFPFEGFMAEDRVASIEFVAPDGTKTALKTGESAGYPTPELDIQGVHILLATQKGGYFTRTRQGNRRQSREGLSDVIRCSYSSNNMKAVLNVGNGGDDNGPLSESFDQALEIVPLSNPRDLRVGDYLDVQVLMRDEPYSGMVFASYAGFSTEGAYAYAVETDNQGKASIRMLSPGQWLVRVNVQQPYPDSEVCDVESYTTTLTFAIR